MMFYVGDLEQNREEVAMTGIPPAILRLLVLRLYFHQCESQAARNSGDAELPARCLAGCDECASPFGGSVKKLTTDEVRLAKLSGANAPVA
jgi:hypothetical protein